MYTAEDINSGLVGNTFVHQCQSSYFNVFFFRELANLLVALGPWLRIPPLSLYVLIKRIQFRSCGPVV